MKTIIRRSENIHPQLEAINIHPVLKKIYSARGIESVDDLERGLNHLLPYHELLGIDAACQCLAEAIEQQQSILVIGDFDADGATSTTLAVSTLRVFGGKFVNYLVPNRFEYGYGLTPEIVTVAKRFNPQVIVTVDNGISSLAGVEAANACGIKVVVTDHHLPGEQLPQATAIVNPQQPNDKFASKCLAGVGVIFYVMLALRHELRQRDWFAKNNIAEPNMAQFLDVVALGTVADLVPLDKNNRILVYQGIQRMRAKQVRPGIAALAKIAGRQIEKISTSDLGFSIGPRLNAAGRLEDMSIGIECLLTDDPNRAHELATQLTLLNEERRLIERDMQNQAIATVNKLQSLSETNLPLGVCLFDDNWHQGVIGLLASRMKDQLHRPVIAFAPGNDATEIKGSARSISGLHIRDVLAIIAAKYPELITKFGGHAMAAGLSLSRANLAKFTEVFAAEVQAQLPNYSPAGEVYSDGELTRDDFHLELAEHIRNAGPWGQTFPEPLFDNRFRLLNQWLVGGKHLKCVLALGEQGKQFDAIIFNVDLKLWPNQRVQYVRAAYKLDINEYQGRRSLQLLIDYLEPTD